MLHLTVSFTAKYLCKNVSKLSLRRNVSALYITGDRAKENYAPLQPYMDFKGTFNNLTPLEQSIDARGLHVDLNVIQDMYAKYETVKEQIKHVAGERETLVTKIKALKENDNASKAEAEQLKQTGIILRNKLKQLKVQSYPIEKDFVDSFLDLPNILHADCPRDNEERLLFCSTVPIPKERRETHLSNKELIRFLRNDCYYLFDTAAEFDVYSMQALTNYFAGTGDFIPMANPDFVRLVLLEASATPIEHYHMVTERDATKQVNRPYLTGGATFEGFLGAFARLVIYPTVLPLQYVACGRSYEKVAIADGQPENLFTATQTNAVQTFVATKTADEAQEQMHRILSLATDFYKELGVHFRIVYADASALTNAESLRATIEMYSPAEQRYICVGRVSNYADYVSKRIMFCIQEKKTYKFPHLVGGPVLYTTRLIALLVEYGMKLEDCSLLGNLYEHVDADNTDMTEHSDIVVK